MATAYIARGEERPTVRILYAEAGFEAVWPLPKVQWQKSIEGACEYAIQQAHKQLKIKSSDLVARPTDPLFRTSRLSPEQWAKRHSILVTTSAADKGLLASKNKLHATFEDFVRKGISTLGVSEKEEKNENEALTCNVKVVENGEFKERFRVLEEENEQLKEENGKLKTQVELLTNKLGVLETQVEHLTKKVGDGDGDTGECCR